MRRSLQLLTVLSLCALAACSKRADISALNRAPPPGASASGASPATADQAANGKPAASPAAPQPRMPMLAMAYKLALAVPSDQVRLLMESHQDACERAGPTQCQVMGAQADTQGRDDATADLNLRATPAWMRAFRSRAEADVKDAHGKVIQSATEAEDLAKPIGDTQASQKTRAEEEARLKDLLQQRSRHLGDSLAVEQEITRVQDELNEQASALQDMQDRVALQTLSIHYQSLAQVAPTGANAPVISAARSFWGNMMGVLGGLLVLFSYLLPIALVVGGSAWLVRRSLRQQAPPKSPSPNVEGPAVN
ncbi:DUF4349 domain-containing protein [Caulobacter sp. KR2-114]|uniref:DUF4349 domain-containing protein n=1 Tax=Caulobacter sp. KR2-114 TaxID=3400912 RepID=UPI003BFF9D0B